MAIKQYTEHFDISIKKTEPDIDAVKCSVRRGEIPNAEAPSVVCIALLESSTQNIKQEAQSRRPQDLCAEWH